jgi:hypothetical protein
MLLSSAARKMCGLFEQTPEYTEMQELHREAQAMAEQSRSQDCDNAVSTNK